MRSARRGAISKNQELFLSDYQPYGVLISQKGRGRLCLAKNKKSGVGGHSF